MIFLQRQKNKLLYILCRYIENNSGFCGFVQQGGLMGSAAAFGICVLHALLFFFFILCKLF